MQGPGEDELLSVCVHAGGGSTYLQIDPWMPATHSWRASAVSIVTA